MKDQFSVVKDRYNSIYFERFFSFVYIVEGAVIYIYDRMYGFILARKKKKLLFGQLRKGRFPLGDK